MDNPIEYYFYRGGANIQPPGNHYCYVVARNGVFKSQFGRFVDASICVAKPGRLGIVGLKDWVGGVVLKVPKIPCNLLNRVVDHAKRAGENDVVLRPVEQMYHFHYIEGRWRVAIPKQEGTAGNVRYKGGDAETIVLDLHSHHSMRAYFSDTDNNDELGFRFYGVIGRIYDKAEIRLRLGLYGDYEYVPVSSIFERRTSSDVCMINDLLGVDDDD